MKSKLTLDKALPYLLIIFGIIGIVAAFVLTEDKFKLLQNPNYHPSCSLNPTISCGSVIKSKQAEAFGFPNPFLGLIGYAAVFTIGVTLVAGAKFKRWFWQLVEVGAIFGVGFVHYLFFQSVYRIGALCLFCISVWIATIGLFVYVTAYNLRHGHLGIKSSSKVLGFLLRHHTDIYITWLLIIAGLVVHRFWYYFSTL